ncbi:MAG TPA: non-homologous end-joining DNA ligase, partial [Luteimonas sp.]|nr:non-homologous end-joining DNA ligase [Luteimonas sp.]
MSLTEYRRKRAFDKTREPEPGKPMPRGARTIFVVQLHHASRRHYDFRLQVGDALKSWAVPKGPSFDPAVKRMAVEVEDHPVDYAGFEGDIPQGQYGGGHVALFDTGVWSTPYDAEAQLAKGHLRFELFGSKLKGEWHLVRSGKPARQPQWLLFKSQDRHAGPVEADDLLDDVTPDPRNAARPAKAPGAGNTTRGAVATRGTDAKAGKGTKVTKAGTVAKTARATRATRVADASKASKVSTASKASKASKATKATTTAKVTTTATTTKLAKAAKAASARTAPRPRTRAKATGPIADGTAPPPTDTTGPIRAGKTDKASKASKAGKPKAGQDPERWADAALALPGGRRRALANEAFEPQLARLGETPPAGEDWLHEAKWDGYRLVAVIQGGTARLWSRNALEWTHKVPEIVAALEQLGVGSAALDGELIAGAGRQADFGLLQATLSGEASGQLSYALFDLLHLEGVDITRAPQLARKDLLARLLESAAHPLRYSSHVVGHGDAAYAHANEAGLEGIISKRASAPYRGGRGDDWRKTKHLLSDEFAVVGFTAPKGSRSGFGSLLLARPVAGGGWQYAGRVGSGFSDELLRTLTKALDRDTTGKPTVEVPEMDTALRSARWLQPAAVVEVFYRGIGNQGLLRQPSLKAVRADKSPADLRDSDRGTAPAPTATPRSRRTRTRAQAAVDGQGAGTDVPDAAPSGATSAASARAGQRN